MTAVVLLSIYCGVLAFAVGCVRRVLQYARTPVHLRWELYPVPLEKPERVEHGGSYFEESEWWTKKRSRNVLGEIRFMAPEMLLLRGLWEYNRKLWFRSFPFHAGLYLLIIAALLSVVNACAAYWAAVPAIGAVSAVLVWVGLVLTIVGAGALLHRRISDPELRNYTSPADLFNLGMFAVATGLVIAGRLTGPMPSVNVLSGALLRFDTSVQIPATAACGLVIGAFMTGYVPFTHMGHFVAKYFTYHMVRWDDTPVSLSRKIPVRIAEQLAYRPSWSAPHIGADGFRTWAEIATAPPKQTEEVRNEK